MCSNRSVTLYIILYSCKDCIIDIVTYVYFAREEVAHIEVCHPTSICSQCITTRSKASIKGECSDKLTLLCINLYTLHKLTLWGNEFGIDITRSRIASKQRRVHKITAQIEGFARTIVRFIGHQIEFFEDAATAVE